MDEKCPLCREPLLADQYTREFDGRRWHVRCHQKNYTDHLQRPRGPPTRLKGPRKPREGVT